MSAQTPATHPPSAPSAHSPRELRVPQQARSRRTREKVLEAAIECFERAGYDDTTTAMIAAEAGIAVGTLYGYFRHKRQILLELLDHTVAELVELTIERLEPESWRGTDPRETARSLIDAVFHTQHTRPGIQRILWERYFKDDDFRAPFEAMRARTRQAIDQFIEAVEAQGMLREIDHSVASFVILNAVQWNSTQVFMQDDVDVDAAAAATAELVGRYLFRDAPEPT